MHIHSPGTKGPSPHPFDLSEPEAPVAPSKFLCRTSLSPGKVASSPQTRQKRILIFLGLEINVAVVFAGLVLRLDAREVLEAYQRRGGGFN